MLELGSKHVTTPSKPFDCPICRGLKKLLGMGCFAVDCHHCKGTGYTNEIKAVDSVTYDHPDDIASSLQEFSKTIPDENREPFKSLDHWPSESAIADDGVPAEIVKRKYTKKSSHWSKNDAA